MGSIKFQSTKSPTFDSIIKKKVETYFNNTSKSKKASSITWCRIALLATLWLLLYGAIFFFPSNYIAVLAIYLVLGILSVMLIFSSAHDAAHFALSNKTWVNRAFSYLWNFFGISEYFWRLKHNISHHTHTNIPGNDMDVNLQGLIRLSPKQELRPYHKFQFIYAPLIYCFFTLYLIFFIDFKLLGTNSFAFKKVLNHPTKQYWIIIFSKLFHISCMILVPYFALEFSLAQMLLAFFVLHFSGSLLAAFTFFPSHHAIGSKYVLADQNNLIHKSWMEHQMEVSLDYAAYNWFINGLTGGLNNHVAHHLFPGVCHIHYPIITKIIEEQANLMGLTYVNRPWGTAINEHFRFLRILGRESQPQGFLIESSLFHA